MGILATFDQSDARLAFSIVIQCDLSLEVVDTTCSAHPSIQTAFGLVDVFSAIRNFQWGGVLLLHPAYIPNRTLDMRDKKLLDCGVISTV